MASSSATSRLFAYPSAQARKKLSPSRLSTLYQTVSSSLQLYLKSPNTSSYDEAVTFIRTYAQDAASQTVQDLIWAASKQSNGKSTRSLTPAEKSIRKSTLLLAEKIAQTGKLSTQTLIDLATAYASSNAVKMKRLFELAVKANSTVSEDVKSQLVPALTTLLSSGHTGLGLYGLRKTAHIIKSFIYSSPPELVKLFIDSPSHEFVLALAKAYDHGLATIARSYGGLSAESLATPDNASASDDWHYIFVSTKVDLIDTFHIIMNTLLSSETRDIESVFTLAFALLELPPSNPGPSTSEGTPFLNNSLLYDYQHSYNLLGSLQSSSTSQDPRLDILSPSLSPFSSSDPGKEPGALRLILSSSGVPPGVDNRGKGRPSEAIASSHTSKGKAKSDAPPKDSDIDVKVAQVLDIFPDHPTTYIRSLLPFFDGSSEKVIEALLEGTAPSQDALEQDPKPPGGRDEIGEYVKTRRNVFDDQEMDLSKVTFGKQSDPATNSFLDSSNPELALLKADILRRVEQFSDEEEDTSIPTAAAAFDDESEGLLNSNVKVSGDGEEEGDGSEEDDDDDDDDDGDVPKEPQTPEEILERAYIQDPKVFDRDAATKRGKEREDLRKRTGWDDPQIEGWKIMLERDPKKKQALVQKYEFERPQNHLVNPAGPSNSQSQHSNRGRGGRGNGGGGRGRGRGGRGGGGGGTGNDARDRARKERNKSSRATRGRDKKIEKMGGV